jgi:hypothetical protein
MGILTFHPEGGNQEPPGDALNAIDLGGEAKYN